MRRKPAWLAGGLALAGLVLFRARGKLTARGDAPREQPSPAVDEPDARAAELRRKLDESRPLVDERDEFEGAETTVDRAEPSEPRVDVSVDDRRRAIHDEGRATGDAMRTPPTEEEAGPVHDA